MIEEQRLLSWEACSEWQRDQGWNNAWGEGGIDVGHEVNRMTGDLLEPLRESKLIEKRHWWVELHQQIDIAGGSGLSPGKTPEEVRPLGSMGTQGRQKLFRSNIGKMLGTGGHGG